MKRLHRIPSKAISMLLLLLAATIPAHAAEKGVMWVVKRNAALQCEGPNEASLALGEKELKNGGVEVLGSELGSSEMKRSKECTTQIAVFDSYLVRKKEKNKAFALGFEKAPKDLKHPYKTQAD